MRARSLLVVAALLAAAPTRAGDAPGAFAPYEDLIEVVAGLTWHLHDDVYRFPPPRDPTGHDLYRLTLRRLDGWEKRYPNRLRDVTLFTRAETLERLGEYRTAADTYRQVTALASPLAEPAHQALDRVTPFAEAAALPENAATFEDRLTALRRKLDAWGKLVERHAGTPYEALALVEEERLERLAASLVTEHRRDLEDGTATAERSLRFLVEKHADSKNLPSHILRLGDLYADLTREYVADHERPLAFDEDEFVKRADRALDTYRKVATWDGAREKPEGQGRFAALDAYKTAVLARYR
jgi:hypothetical protein